MGRSVSVRVGDGLGDENREEGKDSTRGDDEKLMMAFRDDGRIGMSCQEADDSDWEISYCAHPVKASPESDKK